MDDATPVTIANRDEAIPVIRIPPANDLTTSASESRPHSTGRDKIKDKPEEYGAAETRQSLQDRLFAGLMSPILARDEDLSETDADNAEQSREKTKDRPPSVYIERPNFSLPLMSSNFRRFNARIGVVFNLQSRLIRLFTWRHPTATLSFLALYTLLCLNPHLLPLVPLLGTLFTIMIPAFLARHPAPANDPRLRPSFRGPPVAPPSRVKPAPEMSRDFLRNMRDLQNCMEDFSRLHDAANDHVAPRTNFSDERVSSGLFAALFAASGLVLAGAHAVPWRPVALLAGWAGVGLGHPAAQAWLADARNVEPVWQRLGHVAAGVRNWVEMDVVLDGPPEARQVEIFELQRWHASSDTWEPWLFAPAPYDPLSPARIAGARAKGTQFFVEVQAPRGWRWKDKKWSLDLSSREWVEQRMITGVEIETEGERWVYDLPPEETEGLLGSAEEKRKKKTGGRVPKSGWEEATGRERRGQWRRRRWVRVVERSVSHIEPAPG